MGDRALFDTVGGLRAEHAAEGLIRGVRNDGRRGSRKAVIPGLMGSGYWRRWVLEDGWVLEDRWVLIGVSLRWLAQVGFG